MTIDYNKKLKEELIIAKKEKNWNKAAKILHLMENKISQDQYSVDNFEFHKSNIDVQKTRVLHKEISVDKHGFEYTVNELINMYKKSQEFAKWHGEILTNTFRQYKKSDELFILGSGPSINLISDKQWEHISSQDSIGFNLWIAHDFIPSFYMFQLGFKNNHIDIFFDKLNKYQNIPFILRGSMFAKNGIEDKKTFSFLNQVILYYLCEYPIHSTCSIPIYKLFEYLDCMGFMTHGSISKFIPKFRCTLCLLIMLGYQMGYKNIILCGFDMIKDDHFWDYLPYKATKDKYSLPDINTSDMPRFNNPNVSKNTVVNYVLALKEWFYKKNQVNIYIANNQTLLYPKIETYKF